MSDANSISKSAIDEAVSVVLGPDATWPQQDSAHELICAALIALGFEVVE